MTTSMTTFNDKGTEEEKKRRTTVKKKESAKRLARRCLVAAKSVKEESHTHPINVIASILNPSQTGTRRESRR